MRSAIPFEPAAEQTLRLVVDGRRLTASRTGVGRYLERLLHDWASTSLPARDIVVALSDAEGLARIPRVDGMQGMVVAPRLPGLLWERFGLGRVLRRGDLLFAPSNLIPSGWLGPTLLVLFDLLLEERPQDFPWHVRLRFRARYCNAAQRATRILVPSEATGRDLARHYGVDPCRIRVIQPSRDPRFVPQDPDSEEVKRARIAIPGLDDHPFFLFAGKRSRRRHISEILEAFAMVRHELSNHRLVFVGPDEPRFSHDHERVILADHVSEETLTGLMADADALLYPSEYEGFGLPIVEAMAAGCPVITLRRPAVCEAGGDAPIYLDEATPGLLADAMKRVAMDPAFRSRHVAIGLTESARIHLNTFGDDVRREIQLLMNSQGDVRP